MGFDFRDARDRVWGIVRAPGGGFVRAVRRPQLERAERAILLALIEFAPNIEPSVATLAVMLETDERVIRLLLRSLGEKGYLRVVQRPGLRSRYEINLPSVEIEDPPSENTPPPENEPLSSGSGVPLSSGSGVPLSSGSPEADNRSGQEKRTTSATASAAGTFALEAPSPKAKDQNKTREPNGVSELWDHHHREFERIRGEPPVFTRQQRGAAGKAWKNMLEAIPLADCRLVITRAIEAGYHVQPTAILANLNRYRGKHQQRPTGSGNGTRRGIHVQRGLAPGIDLDGPPPAWLEGE